jgi:hypothetical protein
VTSPDGVLRRPRALNLILAVAAAATLVAGCDPGAFSSRADDPEQGLFEEVATLPAHVPSEDVAHGWELAAGVGDLPGLATAVRTEPGQGSEVGLWTWTGGEPMHRASEDLAVPGAVSSVHLAAGPKQALLAVTSWDGHTLAPSLRTSTDRRAWSVLDVPPDLAGVRWDTAGVAGEALVAAGSDRSGHAHVLVVEGDAVRSAALPEVADGDERRALGVAGSGADLAVLAAVGRRGGLGVVGVYTSADGGRTFGPFTAVDPDAWAEADGIAWTGTEYVVTGSVPRTADDPYLHQPVAWVSPDGAAWVRGDVATPGGEDWEYLLTSDLRVGRPAAAPDGTVTAVLTHAQRTSSVYVRRDPAGRWTAIEQESTNDATAVGGTAVLAPDGLVYAVHEHDGGATVERVSSEGWTQQVSEMMPPDDAFDLRGVVVEPGRLRLSGSRDVASGTGAERSSTSQVLSAGYDGGSALVADTQEVPGLQGASWSAYAADPTTGAAVALVTRDDGATTTVTAAFRPGTGQPWQPATGFEDLPWGTVRMAERTPTGWIAGGYAGGGRGAVPGAPGVSLWESSDGTAWHRVEGVLEGDVIVRRLCALADGTPVAIGGVESEGMERAATWRPVAGVWQRTDVGPQDGGSSLRSCVTTGNGLLLGGELDGAAVTWRSADGITLEEPVVLAERGRVQTTLDVPGGFAATGQTDDAEHTGAVVWLSADGATWTRHAVPARASTDAYLAAELDGDLVVVLGGDGGDEVRVLRDVGEVLAASARGDS